MEQNNSKLRSHHKFAVLIGFISLMVFQSCGKVAKVDIIPMRWSSFDLDLPEGIEVYMGINQDIPLKAWVAKIDLSHEDISVKVLSSNDKDQRDTPMQFSKDNNARIIINGGYFNSEKNPVEHVGLLKTNGKLEEPASHSVYRDSERYFISRGAFGITYNGVVDIAWCSTKNDSIFQWERPITNRPGYPNDSLPFSSAYYWDVRDALHAGPVLISNGKIDLNIEDEVFFNTPVAGVQPRSAIGYTIDQHLVLMVVDGRQAESRGVYLEELALMMSEFKCIEALNLDGGGSSTMIADNRLLNRPSGRTAQREVMSAIGVFYK
ncbi:phosphodiester glycosidase family protein [Candidatus Marinimicrobia bacterium]|nr:phosphodiester glycosidase family protein [Candidatus Neomarinimicrobiota bacterium]